jgi:hypothetical protein
VSDPDAGIAEPLGRTDVAVGQPQRATGVRLLRILAVVGTVAVLLWHLVALRGVQPRQGWGFIVLALAGLAVGVTLAVLLPRAAGRLLRHKDLLVPLGLYISAEALVMSVALIPVAATVLHAAWPVSLFAITISLSLLFAIQLLLAAVYATWTTVLVVQTVREGRVDLVGGFTDLRRCFLRVFGAAAIGWAVLFAGLAGAIALGASAIALALLLIGAGSLVWNLATAALLPAVVAERGSFGAALRQGFRLSSIGLRRWWLPVVVQMALLGWVTYIHISYTTSPQPGSTTTQTKTNWQVSGFWTGGYENTCRWHGELMKAVEAEPLPLVSTLLGMLFAVLAIALKLRIMAEMNHRVTENTEKTEQEQGEFNEL